jgi:hypothetical protein
VCAVCVGVMPTNATQPPNAERKKIVAANAQHKKNVITIGGNYAKMFAANERVGVAEAHVRALRNLFADQFHLTSRSPNPQSACRGEYITGLRRAITEQDNLIALCKKAMNMMDSRFYGVRHTYGGGHSYNKCDAAGLESKMELDPVKEFDAMLKIGEHNEATAATAEAMERMEIEAKHNRTLPSLEIEAQEAMKFDLDAACDIDGVD